MAGKILVLTGFVDETSTLSAVLDQVTVLQGTDGRQRLLSNAQSPDGIAAVISWGTCGGLQQGVQVGTISVPNGIDHDDWSKLDAHPWSALLSGILKNSGQLTVIRGPVFSGPVEQTDSAEQKAAINRRTACWTSDEGTYAVAQWADKHVLPWAAVGGVSDDWEQDVIWPPGAMRADGMLDWDAAMAWVRENPGDLPTILREWKTAGYAEAALRIAASVLGAAGWGLS